MVAILSTSYHALHLQISIPSPINCILKHFSFLSSYHNHWAFLHQLLPCPFSQALFLIIMNLLKSLSSYLKKKKKSPSSIYIFFDNCLPLAKILDGTVYSIFHFFTPFTQPAFKNFTNTAFANIISNLLFMTHPSVALCRDTLSPVHSHSLDPHAAPPPWPPSPSHYGALPVGSVYNLAGHSSTSSTNPFQNTIFPWLQLPTLYY